MGTAEDEGQGKSFVDLYKRFSLATIVSMVGRHQPVNLTVSIANACEALVAVAGGRRNVFRARLCTQGVGIRCSQVIPTASHTETATLSDYVSIG